MYRVHTCELCDQVTKKKQNNHTQKILNCPWAAEFRGDLPRHMGSDWVYVGQHINSACATGNAKTAPWKVGGLSEGGWTTQVVQKLGDS